MMHFENGKYAAGLSTGIRCDQKVNRSLAAKLTPNFSIGLLFESIKGKKGKTNPQSFKQAA